MKNYLFSHSSYASDRLFCVKNYNYLYESNNYGGERELIFVIKEKDSYSHRQGHLYYSPHPRSRASLLLLNESLARQEQGLETGSTSNNIFLSLYSSEESICCYCFKPVTMDQRSVDHHIPFSRGGKDSYDNLRLSCEICNSIKSDIHPEQESDLYSLLLSYLSGHSLKKGSQEVFLIDCIKKGFSSIVIDYLKKTNQNLISVKRYLNNKF